MHFLVNDTATTKSYTLSLHDALPICAADELARDVAHGGPDRRSALALRVAEPLHPEVEALVVRQARERSEEHTSELQSQSNLVCRLLLEKKIYSIMYCDLCSRVLSLF